MGAVKARNAIDILKDHIQTKHPSRALYIEYQMIREEWMKRKGWSNRFTVSDIDDEFDHLVIQARMQTDTQNLSDILKAWLTNLDKYNVTLTALVPIVGVSVPEEGLQIGHMRLLPFNDRTSAELIRPMFYTETKAEAHPTVSESYLTDRYLEHLSADGVTTLALVPTVGLEDSVQRAGEAQVRVFLDMVRFVEPLTGEEDDLIRVGLQGEVFGGRSRATLVVGAANKLKTFATEAIGPLISVAITTQWLKLMEETEVRDLINNACGDGQLTELESMLLTAIHWYAVAQLEPAKESKLLALMICLESLVGSSDPTDPITTLIAENVALLVEDNPLARHRVRERIKKDLYSKRSKIAHGKGTNTSKDGITDADIQDLRGWSRALILGFLKLRQRFTQRQQIKLWFEQQRLGAPRDLDDAATSTS